MRVAFVSPMPPARSGIADYSAALLFELGKLAEIDLFSDLPSSFNEDAYDAILYQLGNNPFHAFVYEMALAHPGVVVLHEGNLHHLIAEMTIGRGDWEGYIAEADYNGGPVERAYAQRVRAREVGPNYQGLAMTRRLLERSRALIVHSTAVEHAARTAGFRGPMARIPHGAWIPPETDRWAFRDRLGLDATTPLVGIFGFLKPYKRIAESLRAFRRILKLAPRARMILVGETHPDFPVRSLINTLGLAGSVHVLGYTSIENFVGYMAACDMVLNLRYPTVGENSGSMLRAFGLGRPVLVSDVGAFQDLPDDICLKVPVDATEETQIFEFLRLLVTRPDLAKELGQRAKSWVERECTWGVVAGRYFLFLEELRAKPHRDAQAEAAAASVGASEPAADEPAGEGLARPISATAADLAAAAERLAPPAEQGRLFPVSEMAPSAPPAAPGVPPEAILEWVPRQQPAMRGYVETHLTRLAKTLDIIPPGRREDRILEMGSYLQITPSLQSRLGYGEVRGCYFGKAGTTEYRTVTTEDGKAFTCPIDLFDAEHDRFPYPDEHFATVLCCEIIEHLVSDPMHMIAEVNRVLRPDGRLVLTTPNIASLRAVGAILQGYHPGLFPQYIKPSADGTVDPRHSREYAPREIQHLLEDAGFEVLRLETGPFRDQPTPELVWVRRLLERYELAANLRDEGIYAMGRKTGPVRDRYPAWLYV